MMFFGFLLFVLGIGVIAYILGWRPDFLKPNSNYGSPRKPSDSALEILQERYARGEIDEDEYLRMKRDLKS